MKTALTDDTAGFSQYGIALQAINLVIGLKNVLPASHSKSVPGEESGVSKPPDRQRERGSGGRRTV
jgi:hypothetical protein